jgi:putative protease
MLFDHELDLMQQTLQMLHQAGFRNFELTNPGQFKLMEQFDDLRLSGG